MPCALIVFFLARAPAIGLPDSVFQGLGPSVGIEQDPAVNVSRRASNSLNQRCLGTEIAFLVRVQDGDQGAFRDVESFAQQVDADQNVEDAEAEITDDLDPLQGVDVGMDVADLKAGFRHVFGEIFRHAFRERGNQNPLIGGDRLVAFRHNVVDLCFGRSDDAYGVRSGRSAARLVR